MLGKLARLPLGWFTARGSGSVKQIVQDDTLSLHYLITHAVSDAVAAVFAPVAVLIYLFTVDWRIALLLFVPVLVYIVTMAVMLVQSKAKTAQAVQWADRMNGEAGAYLEGQPVIRVFGGAAASGFRARLDEYIAFLNDWQRPFTGKKTVMDLASRPATFLLLIAGFGTLLITTGSMDPVSLLPFLLLEPRSVHVFWASLRISGLRDGLLAARRIQVTLDEPELLVTASEEVYQPSPAPSNSTGSGFPSGRASPSSTMSRSIVKPGSMTALVGPSGSGKSTLAGLLARFHDVQTGAIRIGGKDVRQLTADELYTRVGFVFQDTQLVHGTVRENIALAVPERIRFASGGCCSRCADPRTHPASTAGL